MNNMAGRGSVGKQGKDSYRLTVSLRYDKTENGPTTLDTYNGHLRKRNSNYRLYGNP